MVDRFAGGNRYARLDTSVKFGVWLRARLKEYGVSVSVVAEDIGVAPGTVYNWLKGKLPRLPRGGEVDKFEEELLRHPALALSSRQREELAEQRRVLIGASAVVALGDDEVSSWPQRDLPTDVATFTGRNPQLDQLDRLLARKERGGAVVISALSGMGGVGKTALAVHWAHTPEVRRTFPAGAAYVNLNGFSETEPMSPQEAQAGLLRQLGVKPQAIPLDADALAGVYHDTLSGKKLLLVLDNAGDEPQVRPLLPKDSRCLAVVTSRHRLAGLTVSHDATCLSLDALNPRESARLLRRLLGAAADKEPDAVDALAEVCAHLPLALRIAAADHLAGPRRTSLSDHVNALVGDRLGKLAVGSTDPSTALKTVLDRSCQHLAPDAQRALRLLACHPGADWDAYAAAALLDADLDTTSDLIDELHAHSLLDTSDSPTGTRRRMHDLTAEYARTRTDTTQREHALQRLWDHYCRAACLAMDHLAPHEKGLRPSIPAAQGPCPELPDLSQALAWLDAERANLLIAATYCAQHGDSEVVRDLAAAIYRYLEQQGHWRDGAVLHRLECEHTDPAHRHHALNRLGLMRQQLGSPIAARGLYEQALTLARQAADPVGEINALNLLGIVSERLGHLEDAISRYSQATAAARAERDDVRLGRALGNLGNVYNLRGDYDLAADCCRQALALTRATGNRPTEALTLNNLGRIYESKGDLTAAVDCYRQGLDLARHIGSKTAERLCLGSLGCVSEHNGQYEQAMRYYDEALRLAEQLEDQAGKANVLNELSVTLRRLQRNDEADARAREALKLATAVDNPREQARAHDNIAHTLAAQGDPETARQHWTQALHIFEQLDTPEADEIKQHLADTPGVA
ncbi:MAG: tetratricopeptide repeat protein [Stackebrandtia sp.]